MRKGYGWLRDRPDIRDYRASLKLPTGPSARPSRVDLSADWPPIQDQGPLGSCTAFAAAGIYEYLERRANLSHVILSRRFIYKVTRELIHLQGDTGAYLRSAMGAMRLFGVPSEEHWPYDVDAFDAEPSAFAYAYAQNFQAIDYHRVDEPGLMPVQILDAVKRRVAQKLPVMMGWTCYSSLDGPDADRGFIPFPAKGEGVIGGHATAVAGYDDTMQCPNATLGALLLANSWGKGWGLSGFGWLPYDYILQGQADDIWCMTKAEWIEAGIFAE